MQPNPFSFVGASSLLDNFIGRDKQIREITERAIADGMVCIVGLPRMGKTSLVHHVFLEREQPDWWTDNHQMIPIYVTLEGLGTAKGFWGALASNLRFTLQTWQENHLDKDTAKMADCMEILKDIRRMPDADDRFSAITDDCLNSIRDNFGLRMIFIIDELDKVMKEGYKYSREDFDKLRRLSDFGCIVTCSRRTPSAIEQAAFHSSYFDNKSIQVFVGTFGRDDVKRYWTHFRDAFGELDKKVFSRYKELVTRYAGSHPYLMSLMNYHAIESGNINLWRQKLDTNQRYQVEGDFRRSLVDAFKTQMGYIEEQGLKEVALTAMLGGTKEKDFEENLSLLQKYTFLQMVESQEKRDIFAYDLGLVTADNKHRYVCMSPFFSHYLRDNYNPSYKDSELLKVTELKLRDLIRWFLKDKFGPNALDIKNGDEYSDNYEEQWEQFYKKDRKEKGAPLYTKEEQDWAEIRRRRKNLLSNDCKPLGERPRIDWLTGTTLMNLWDFFVNCYWRNFFRVVLVPENVIGNNDYVAEKKNWRNNYFEPLHRLRNGNAHYNDEIFTEASVTNARVKCRQICQAIDNWMAKKGDEMMEI